MMPEIPRHLKITIGIMLGAVIAGAVYFRFLAKRIYAPPAAEQAATEPLAPPSLAAPSDVPTRVTLYLAEMAPAAEGETTMPGAARTPPGEEAFGRLVPRSVQVPLASVPSLRAKQLLQAWLAASQERPGSLIPKDAHVREVFVASDGAAYADFSTEMSLHAISGIASESLIVYSIVNTLAANVSEIRQVKILINGQEAETLAGHIDLDRFYTLAVEWVPSEPGAPAPPAPGTGGAPAKPVSQRPAR